MHIKKIIFTGGGSAGHVTPNLALMKKFQAEGWDVSYIGSYTGIEKELVNMENFSYFAISTGKLRRYFSWQNFCDPFKIVFGVWQAYRLCRKLKPQVIFSKGGFVSFPVVIAAWLLHIPVVIHESDLIPGLANKLSYPFARKICLTFTDSEKYFNDKSKLIVTGTPLRSELFLGDATKGRVICGFDESKKVILVIGGSLGAEVINKVIRQLLPDLIDKFQVAHICGAGKVEIYNESDPINKVYKQFTYLREELPHVIAAADIVISRAGANSVYELLALRKAHIFIPLSRASSRGDQIANAQYFSKLGFSQVLLEEQLTVEALLTKILWVAEHQPEIINSLSKFIVPKSIDIIYDVIKSQV